MKAKIILFCSFFFWVKITFAANFLPAPPASTKLAFHLTAVSAHQFDLFSYNFKTKSWERILGYVGPPGVDSCELGYYEQKGLFALAFYKGKLEKTLLLDPECLKTMRQSNLEYLQDQKAVDNGETRLQ